MKQLWLCPLLILALWSVAAASGAEDAPQKQEDGETYQVPYRLTAPKHIMIRAKLNGKGPFNFILDTGAPAMFITNAVADKCGVKPDKYHWGTLDKFDIEGGVPVGNTKLRVEEIPQLKAMNALGLAGVEIHGMIGYDVLARYRMEIDVTQNKMVWTELKWTPTGPKGMGGKGGSQAGSLEMIGMVMEMLGKFMGAKANAEVAPRGFLGIALAAAGDKVTITAVLENSPAAKAGVKAGDRLAKIQGHIVENLDDVRRYADKLTAQKEIKLTILRGQEAKDVTFKTGEGL